MCHRHLICYLFIPWKESEVLKCGFLQQVAWRGDLLFSCQIYHSCVLPCSPLHTPLWLFMAAVNFSCSGKELQQQVNRQFHQRAIPQSWHNITSHNLTKMKNNAHSFSPGLKIKLNVCVCECFRARAAIPDWFQTGVSVVFRKGIFSDLLFLQRCLWWISHILTHKRFASCDVKSEAGTKKKKGGKWERKQKKNSKTISTQHNNKVIKAAQTDTSPLLFYFHMSFFLFVFLLHPT